MTSIANRLDSRAAARMVDLALMREAAEEIRYLTKALAFHEQRTAQLEAEIIRLIALTGKQAA
jgi:hypothetical protein